MNNQFLVRMLPLNQLELDKDNPRIRKWIEHYGDNPSSDQMLLALGAGTSEPDAGSSVTFQSLKESIRAQGSIINPIIVQKLSSDRYRVIEGNTRVAIYRSFLEDEVSGSWDSIFAVIRENVPQAEVDAIRLQCHIVGARAWDPYSKAKYLSHLHNVENMPLGRIVDLCGGRKKEISEYIEAYHDMEKYYRPALDSDSDFDTTRFSAFIELQKSGVKEAIFEAQFTLTDFATWVSNRNIDPLNTVRAIPRILKNPQARQKFLTVNAKEAMKVLEVPASPVLTNVPLEQLLRLIIERLTVLPYSDVKALKQDPGSQRAQLLLEANESLSELCKELAGE